MYKILEQKKRQKSPSIKREELYEYCNTINVLNTIGIDDNEIGGYLLSKYHIPKFISDLIIPRTVSYPGTRKGRNFLSVDYINYDPSNAGYVNGEKYDELVVEDEDEILSINQLINDNPRSKVGKFKLLLDPLTFEVRGGALLATFKHIASEDRFNNVDDLKVYGNLTVYGDQLTPCNEHCKPSVVKYLPLYADQNLYLHSEYFENTDDMFEDWFRACCDTLLSTK